MSLSYSGEFDDDLDYHIRSIDIPDTPRSPEPRPGSPDNYISSSDDEVELDASVLRTGPFLNVTHVEEAPRTQPVAHPREQRQVSESVRRSERIASRRRPHSGSVSGPGAPPARRTRRR